MMGIDEAGRGPVLGPLVYASAVVPVADAGRLHDLGCDDSKALTEAQRDVLLARMAAAPFLQIQTVTLPAATLSAAMTRRPPVSLNTLSFDAAFALVRDALGRGIPLSALYVDTVGDPDRYAARLRSAFPSIGTVVVAKKADATYRVVGAASIAAKCKRDRDLRAGYPGDGVTKAWLAAHVDSVFGFPSLVRFSWSTVRVLLANTPAAVGIRWEGDDDDERDAATRATPAITSFFGASPAGRAGAGPPPPPPRVAAPFFRVRHIAPATSFFA
ncbi:hypothetical protein I4F81_004786 [Pyropia yezoensis]|uniref:Uncharacterized protein n=1 Tax=Pyropia yezoensis TaxID=2788 RepID=A0ACC3BWY5_PYRYE|nr:hypothetical protein I4F81_004786 [Neopyropia yezoensis]